MFQTNVTASLSEAGHFRNRDSDHTDDTGALFVVLSGVMMSVVCCVKTGLC